MTDRHDLLHGSLGLIVLKTLAARGPMHGYRIARQIEEISGHQLALNQGTLYPALLKLEQAKWISAKWTESETGRQVKTYSLTAAGRKQVQVEVDRWRHATGIVAGFLTLQPGGA